MRNNFKTYERDSVQTDNFMGVLLRLLCFRFLSFRRKGHDYMRKKVRVVFQKIRLFEKIVEFGIRRPLPELRIAA